MMKKISKKEQLVRSSLGDTDTHSFTPWRNRKNNKLKFNYLSSWFIIDNFFIVTELINDKEEITPASSIMTRYLYLEHRETIDYAFKYDD